MSRVFVTQCSTVKVLHAICQGPYVVMQSLLGLPISGYSRPSRALRKPYETYTNNKEYNLYSNKIHPASEKRYKMGRIKSMFYDILLHTAKGYVTGMEIIDCPTVRDR